MSERRSLREFPVWECKIGTRRAVMLPFGADLPMRRAVERAFREVTGVGNEFNFSGWGGSLTEPELAVVENRLPQQSPATEIKTLRAELAAERARADRLAGLLTRYREETPPGHSPHMICHQADLALIEHQESRK